MRTLFYVADAMCTLQEWEQGRRQPSGAAKTLLKVAERYPEILREVAEAR